MRLSLAGPAFLTALMALTGCTSGSTTVPDAGSQPIADAGVRFTIGEQGGTLEMEGATLVVPPGALDRPVEIVLAPSPEAPPDGYRLFTAAFRVQPEELVFAVPATLSLTITKPVQDETLVTVFGSYRPATFERLDARVVGGMATVELSRAGTFFAGELVDYTAPANPTCAHVRPLAIRSPDSHSAAVSIFFSAVDCNGRPLAGLECLEPGRCAFAVEQDNFALEAQLREIPAAGLQEIVTLLLDVGDAGRSSIAELVGASKALVTDLMVDRGLPVRIGVLLVAGAGDPIVWQDYSLDASALLARLDALAAAQAELPAPGPSNLDGALAYALDRQQRAREELSARNFGGAIVSGHVILVAGGPDDAVPGNLGEARERNPDPIATVTFGAGATEASLRQLASRPWLAFGSQEPAHLRREMLALSRSLAAELDSVRGLAWCTAKRDQLNHKVSVSVGGATAGSAAQFDFVAPAASATCDSETLAARCDGQQCGGPGCGACDDRTLACDQASGACVNHCRNADRCGGDSFVNPPGYLQVCADVAEWSLCANECFDTTTDTAHCGGCGTACAVGGICAAGECSCPGTRGTVCDGSCADLAVDLTNCGECGNACGVGGNCDSGTCTCPGERGEVCSGSCVDLANDRAQCGNCGYGCEGEDPCVAGRCVPDPEWAQWIVPADSPPGDAYVFAAETFRDRVTGLTWQLHVGGRMSFDQASDYCDRLELGGVSDWRLPSRIELVSLIDDGRTAPAINPAVFPDFDPTAPSFEFWSSTRVEGAYGHWVVSFLDGRTAQTPFRSASPQARCVR